MGRGEGLSSKRLVFQEAPNYNKTLISLDRMGQGEITFTKTISIFMTKSNLRLDYFLEFKVGARAQRGE